MIPNSLLRKWVSDESDTITFLERKFLEGEESRRRFQLYQDHEATVEDCVAVLSGKRARTQVVERNLLEKEVTERRLNERHFLGAHRSELQNFEGKIQDAHRRLTLAQERRIRLKSATTETISQEKARWEDERRWMLRQLQTITSPMMSSMVHEDSNNKIAQLQPREGEELKVDPGISALTSDGLSARTNAALARARQVLASTT